jgi:hypothetical protein
VSRALLPSSENELMTFVEVTAFLKRPSVKATTSWLNRWNVPGHYVGKQQLVTKAAVLDAVHGSTLANRRVRRTRNP